MREIEKGADILFVDFFLNNYKRVPMFKDEHHPTRYLLDYIASQLICKLREYINIESTFTVCYTQQNEGEHYKPITTAVKRMLCLDYDLDSYYIVTRKHFLEKILEYDNNDSHCNIDTYEDFYKYVLQIHVL